MVGVSRSKWRAMHAVRHARFESDAALGERPTTDRDPRGRNRRGRLRRRRSIGHAQGGGGRHAGPDRDPGSAPRRPGIARGRSYKELQAAGLVIDANNAGSGETGEEPRRTLVATLAGWPLIINEYSSAKALATAKRWKKGAQPGYGEPPVAIRGMNILVEYGPTTGRKPSKPEGPQASGRRLTHRRTGSAAPSAPRPSERRGADPATCRARPAKPRTIGQPQLRRRPR